MTTARSSKSKLGSWYMLLIAIVLVSTLALQYTRYPLLMARNNTLLWVCTVGSIICILILRSSLGQSADEDMHQADLGTLSNSFYPPRRRAITDGGAILGGVLGGLFWGASSWIIMFMAMRRHAGARGLFDLEMSVVVGALSGGVLGAVIGRFAGAFWEKRHRQQRPRPST